MQLARLTIPLLILGTASNLALTLGPGQPDGPSDRGVAMSVSRAVNDVAQEVTPAVVSVISRSLRGSGVLLDSSGLIVTNHHVTNGATRVRVTLLDGREFVARVVGSDRDTDLAVLDLPGDGYPASPLSESAPPEIGTWVLAIGNPMGLDHTVTFGIISARGRAGVGIALYEDFLQTDAAINSGNSGGPLVNLDGEVVGINTAKEVNFTGNQGLGFAIPAYMVREVVEEIVQKGYVERGYFGVRVRDSELSPATMEGRGSVLVTEVVAKSPAEAAGLEVGDFILKVDGDRILQSRDLFDSIAALEPGRRVNVDVWRDQRLEYVSVLVGERELTETPVSSRR